MLQLTVWMNMPSFYQGDLFKSLVASGKVDLQVIFAKNLTPDRLQLGWQNHLTGYTYHVLNPHNPIREAIHLARSQPERIHIVNGIWAEASFAAALVMLALSKSRYGIYSEAPSPLVSRSPGKGALRAGFGRVIARKASGVFPVSHLAVEFFKSLGVRKQAMYPFGYFRAGTNSINDVNSKSRIEVIFVGQVVYRKGLDILLEAMAPLFEEYPHLALTIVGSGVLLETFQNRIKQLGLADRVTFEGAISSDKIPTRLAQGDVLALPSRWDGWGLVVNEAFSVGLPVIVSDRCGASDLVQDEVNGYVFRSEDVADLRLKLRHFLDRSAEWPRFRLNAVATGRQLSTDTVAPYFIHCLEHMTGAMRDRPRPPWTELNALLEEAR